MTYLYYPHAPILLRVVRHVKRTKKSDGGYRWAGAADRQGWLSNTEADKAIKAKQLMVVTDEEAKKIAVGLEDLVRSRMAYSQKLAASSKLTKVQQARRIQG